MDAEHSTPATPEPGDAAATDGDDARSATAGTPEPMTVSEPERVRAVAHPVRMALIDLLSLRGELTASQCADALDQTVANCSFHLRQLEKAGFVERATPRGREKPWRAVPGPRTFQPDLESPASMQAVGELAAMSVRQEAERIVRYLQTWAAHEEGEWLMAINLTTAALWATHEEATELVEQLSALLDGFYARRDNPELRPEGARLVRFMAAMNPEPIKE